MHGVGLPDIIGKLRFEAAAVDRRRGVLVRSLALEETAEGGLGDAKLSRDDAPSLGFPKHARQRGSAVFLLEADEGLCRLGLRSDSVHQDFHVADKLGESNIGIREFRMPAFLPFKRKIAAISSGL